MYCYKDDACDALEKLTANDEPSDYSDQRMFR